METSFSDRKLDDLGASAKLTTRVLGQCNRELLFLRELLLNKRQKLRDRLRLWLPQSSRFNRKKTLIYSVRGELVEP